MISLKQLRYFDAVVKTGHFGRAAEQCEVTQPALSMQIQDLEKLLGAQLLERGRKGVILTDTGRELAVRAAQVLTDIRDMVELARRHGTVLAGSLHLGVIPTVAPYILPPLLPKLRDAYPQIDLHLRETQTQHLVEELLDGQLDLLLLGLPVDDPNIETIRLFDDRFLLATSQAQPIGKNVRATAELLKQDRLLLLEEGHCLRDQALTFCNLQRAGNIDTSGASSLSTIVQMVANGLGITLLPELSLNVETRQGAIRLIRFGEPEPRRVIGLAWRRSSPRKRHFIELGKLITTVASEQLRRARGG
ncbi:hydrogen peroxide-inducible genes activator [Bradyrhizobium sp. U87765 SZCCT0131]|uniref:hydrogen peroxide-inducible genes activator n=1 Tax=unclassified Bradyrhizobium TaxID=2631580 RepID=UPI001BA8FDE5|nr:MULTISPECIES: hydrogen peroxide-inducible genes activator [unclassified Bradyrhizobium]MBR1221204.1 hydrogen peroxide-inducible genes activator [Bradyrhizobium sp. U87765 SZCCT0131]MBR1259975.1 hydrogen peroxide-inducible genes activator [Bradyrhizobium sp. U87765 SZCCT0134]MBR1307776.1 hydrogen peroxide-inducible genes activator [Bradyrhizobium sp. U87765 SZCCT0110]MBR1321730.1 hydrogen peroxide-inducible genes activator [Bradyrhizobium sp. U87765 SZCCT0109]MBR1350042.1 hydrogen peroxide-i